MIWLLLKVCIGHKKPSSWSYNAQTLYGIAMYSGRLMGNVGLAFCVLLGMQFEKKTHFKICWCCHLIWCVLNASIAVLKVNTKYDDPNAEPMKNIDNVLR